MCACALLGPIHSIESLILTSHCWHSLRFGQSLLAFTIPGLAYNQLWIHSQHMSRPTLNNYLRMHRRLSYLSQHEMGILVGSKNGAQISRHEHSRRLPSMSTVLAYQAIFAVEVDKLFPGVKQRIASEVVRRAVHLRADLERQRKTKRTLRKLQWLTDVCNANKSKPKHRE